MFGNARSVCSVEKRERSRTREQRKLYGLIVIFCSFCQDPNDSGDYFLQQRHKQMQSSSELPESLEETAAQTRRRAGEAEMQSTPGEQWCGMFEIFSQSDIGRTFTIVQKPRQCSQLVSQDTSKNGREQERKHDPDCT